MNSLFLLSDVCWRRDCWCLPWSYTQCILMTHISKFKYTPCIRFWACAWASDHIINYNIWRLYITCNLCFIKHWLQNIRLMRIIYLLKNWNKIYKTEDKLWYTDKQGAILFYIRRIWLSVIFIIFFYMNEPLFRVKYSEGLHRDIHKRINN